MIIRDRITRYLTKHGPSTSRAITDGLKAKASSVQPELYNLVKAGTIVTSGTGRAWTYAVKGAKSNGHAAVPPTKTAVTATDTALRNLLETRLAHHEFEWKRTKAMLATLGS